ncbi:MAG: PrsW family intramembrane metalloprotease [Flammeovirgaceae bacterium]|nr:PrsW family intramembrane metalloprotease [Flammeovirgaceae bacterium]
MKSSVNFFVRALYNNKHFNEPFDGIVYSVMVGMGFATFENILYVVEGGIGTPSDGPLQQLLPY